MERRPNSLAHHTETDKDDSGDNRPDDLEAIVAVRIGRARFVSRIAIFPDDPTKANLRRGEGNAAHDDRDQELAVNTRPVVGDGLREPPTLIEEHQDRGDRDHPDSYCQKTSHQLAPLR